uniref:Uncharacterized protein n=1 Tax=Trichuris muris TaxID=70415 RepID=A0A5S6Q8T1_TRIMR
MNQRRVERLNSAVVAIWKNEKEDLNETVVRGNIIFVPPLLTPFPSAGVRWESNCWSTVFSGRMPRSSACSGFAAQAQHPDNQPWTFPDDCIRNLPAENCAASDPPCYPSSCRVSLFKQFKLLNSA